MFIGIDYGTKRVGIAVSDKDNTLAFPLHIVSAQNALFSILALISERQPEGVVIGESKNFSGEDNPIMRDIKLFASQIEKTGVTVLFEPEFLTSAAAKRHTKTKRGENITVQRHEDASAAALILQSFLDRRRAVQ